MVSGRALLFLIMAVAAMTASGLGVRPAQADHRCDPIGDPGWQTVPSHEIVSEVDGAPYRGIGICRSDAGDASVAIQPYAGPCPPR